MSSIFSEGSTAAQSTLGRPRADIFQDLPLIDRSTRITIMELKNSDKQIVNELVYRWCRVLTRRSRRSIDHLPDILTDNAVQDLRKIMILDMIGSVNPIRLATVIKRDDRRMRMIGMARGCKINSTYVTLNSHLGRQAVIPSSLKMVVIYHDEFFIRKTLALIKNFLDLMKCHVILIVPRLDRSEYDLLYTLTSNFQVLKCDFCVNRRTIGPAPPESVTESYQTYLNQIYIQRSPPRKGLPDRITGELKDDRVHITTSSKEKLCAESLEEGFVRLAKRARSENSISSL